MPTPLKDFEPFSPLNGQGRDVEPEKLMLNILAPNNVLYQDTTSLKASDARNTCNKWDQDLINFVANEGSLFGQNQTLAERNASEAIQNYGNKPKMKLPKIHSSPNLRINLLNSSRDGSGISKN